MDISLNRWRTKEMKVLTTMIATFMLFSCATVTPGARDSQSIEQREKLLRERVIKMWDAMVRRDRETAYDLHDPFFRAKENKDAFKGRSVPVYHFNPKVESIDIQCNIATVKVKFEYELRGVMVMGKEVSQPRKETIGTETWIFMDNTWYRQYVDNITDSSFVSY
jgi:hypothetical protein